MSFLSLVGHGKQANQHGNDVKGGQRTTRKAIYPSYSSGHEVGDRREMSLLYTTY